MSKRSRKLLKRKSADAQDQRGLILITIVLVISALMIVGFALISSTTSSYILTKNNSFNANALLTAEAGVEQSLQQLNNNDGFGGYPSAQQFFNNAAQGRGEYTTTITSSSTDSNARVITSTGKIYLYNSSKLVGTRIVKVTAVGTQSPGYSVYAGPGGIIMGGSAAINNSDVYSGGGITMTGTTRIGSDLVPSNVYVANYRCPTGNSPGPTYPSLCGSGQPIPIPDWSSVAIIGSVCATGQTQSKFPLVSYNQHPSQIRAGSAGGSGLQQNCNAPYNPPPAYNRNSHIGAVTTTAAGNSNTYTCSSNSSSFDRSWPKDLKLTGNVRVDSSCNIKLMGNVYITGNLDIGGAAIITVDNSLGATRPVIIVDGTITVNGGPFLIANSSGTGIEFISFKSSAGCNPNCTSLSGNELKTSQSLQTVTVGGWVNFPGMIFNAYWGRITVTGSGIIGSAIGQTIDMSGGSGTVTFGTQLSSGSRSWKITSYQQRYPGQP